jgi:hypothetical protein
VAGFSLAGLNAPKSVNVAFAREVIPAQSASSNTVYFSGFINDAFC